MDFEYVERKRKITRYLVCVLLGIFGFVLIFFLFDFNGFSLKKNISPLLKKQDVNIDQEKRIPCKDCKENNEQSNDNLAVNEKQQIDKSDETTQDIQGNDVNKNIGVSSTNLANNSEYNAFVEKLANSVVHIKTIALKDTELQERYDLLNALNGEVFPNVKVKQMFSCSGFFVSKDGYIVTNHHCIDDVKDIDVETKNGNKYSAKIVGYFEGADLAVIKVQPKNGETFNAVKIANSDKLSVGDNVIVIGGPLGYKWSASAGIISGKARNITEEDQDEQMKKHTWGTAGELIQVDAAVNPGNSGGPAFNLQGEVVGVASSGYTLLQGMNFIVSSNTLSEYLPSLKSGKIIQKGLWGIKIKELESYDIKAVGLNKNSGMLITEVVKYGPADKAGLKRGDIITKVDGVEAKDWTAMREINNKVFDGSVSSIEINRYGKLMSFKVKAISVREEEKLEKGEIGIQEWNDRNISYRLLTSKKHKDFRFPQYVHGIIVTGIKNNDDPMLVLAIGNIIMGVNDVIINSIEDYQKAIKNLKKQKKTMAIFHIFDPINRKIIVKGSKFE